MKVMTENNTEKWTGKGSTSRVNDLNKFEENFDKINWNQVKKTGKQHKDFEVDWKSNEIGKCK